MQNNFFNIMAYLIIRFNNVHQVTQFKKCNQIDTKVFNAYQACF